MEPADFIAHLTELTSHLTGALVRADILRSNPVDGKPHDLNMHEELIAALLNAISLAAIINKETLDN